MENKTPRSVNPVKTAAAYVGGKKVLAPKIVELIDNIEHQFYAEPFCGMGGIFFRRTVVPPVEIMNDISCDLVTFFRVLQRHYSAFMDMLKFQFTSRAEFERLLNINSSTLTDLERAVRFLYLQRLSFGGMVNSRSFAACISDTRHRFDVTRLGPLLTDLNERLSGVVIENLDYKDFIDRYDGSDTLFYLDPPYYGSEDYYEDNTFSKDDFLHIAGILKKLKGKFILSINDVPFIRETFANFEIEEMGVLYTLNGAHKSEAKELIINSPGLRDRMRKQGSLFTG